MINVDNWHTPKKIYDAHLHVFNYRGMVTRANRLGFETPEEIVSYMSQRVGSNFVIPPKDDNALLLLWVDELQKNNVDKAIILPDWNSTDIIEIASKEYPDLFFRFMMINPQEEHALDTLKTAYSKYGVHGIKLYPPLHYYHAYDEMVLPFYEFCDDHKLPITFHMGISVGSKADMRFMNPSDVSPIARDFPKLNFLFAHFATGYLRELLFLMYHCNNVYAESSSSNKWIHYLPEKLELKDVFEKIINAKGAEKIVFGTDSTLFPRGWRNGIYERQLAVCNELGLTQEQIDGIFYKNLEKLIPKI